MASFTLMCWNVENLFVPEDNATLAAMIDSQQPDVLTLQEIVPNGALQALQGALLTTLPRPWKGKQTAGASVCPSFPAIPSVPAGPSGPFWR